MSRALVPARPSSTQPSACCRASGLSGAYEEAWQEWEDSGEEQSWDAATADGLSS